MNRRTTLAVLFLLASTVDAAARPRPRHAAVAPVRFEANRGQFHESVAFGLEQGPLGLLIGADAWVVNLFRETRRGSLRIALRGATVHSVEDVAGRGPLAVPTHYLLGPDRDRWVRGVQSYAGVVVHEPWPGIDVAWRDRDGLPSFDLHVAAGADLDRARFVIEGAVDWAVAVDGALALRIATGEIRLSRPRTFEVVDGVERPLAASFEVAAEGGVLVVGIVVPERDASRPLVIDPTLAAATYVGGDDATEPIYVFSPAASPKSGVVYLADFHPQTMPTTTLPNNGEEPLLIQIDRAVAFSPGFMPPGATVGPECAYRTILGPEPTKQIYSVAPRQVGIDDQGRVVVATSYVCDTQFDPTSGSPIYDCAAVGWPVTANAWAAVPPNTDRASVIARLSCAGDELVYASYLARSLVVTPDKLAVARDGAIGIIGKTDCPIPIANIPPYFSSCRPLIHDVEVNAIHPLHDWQEPVVMHIAADDQVDLVTTFGAWMPETAFNGDSFYASNDALYDLDFAPDGSLYVVGSNIGGVPDWAAFPMAGGPEPTHFGNSPYDGFVAKLAPDARAFEWSSIVGTEAYEFAYQVSAGGDSVVVLTSSSAVSTQVPQLNPLPLAALSELAVTHIAADGSAVLRSSWAPDAGSLSEVYVMDGGELLLSVIDYQGNLEQRLAQLPSNALPELIFSDPPAPSNGALHGLLKAGRSGYVWGVYGSAGASGSVAFFDIALAGASIWTQGATSVALETTPQAYQPNLPAGATFGYATRIEDVRVIDICVTTANQAGEPDGAPCTDGDACTIDDACDGGFCVPGPEARCDPPDDCQVLIRCDPADGCVFDPRPDGTPCGLAGQCMAGACLELGP